MSNSENNYKQKKQDISLILKDLLKVIKVVSMYPEDNPLPQSLKRSFAEKLESIVEDYGKIIIEVKKDNLLYNKEVVYHDRSNEENLAGIFFETGMTEFTFKAGLEIEEIYKLLEVIKLYLNAPNKSLDLITLIWEANITQFSFKTLEDIALSNYDDNFNIQEYVDNIEPHNLNQSVFATETNEGYQSIFDRNENDNVEFSDYEPTPATQDERPSDRRVSSSNSSIFYSDLTDQTSKLLSNSDGIDEISLKTSEAATAMGYNDLSHQATTLPNTALILNDEFKLSEEEEESIRKMLSEDAKFDPYEATLEIIKELLLQETEMNGFYESVTISEKIISEFIQASKLAESGRLLQFLKTLENRIRKDKPLWAERLKDAWVTAGSRDRLKILAEALNNYSQISSTELRKYLSNFGWEALNGITDLIEQVEHQHHKDCLSEHLTEKGRDHINIIGKGIFDKRLEVVHNSIKVLATIGNDKALNYLQKVASHNDDSVRRNLVLALRYCPNKNALAILKKAAGDSIPEIRKDAVEAIINRRGRPAFEAITEIINNDNFSALEQNDQQALLNAFSILGGDKAVGFLVSLILNYNYFRNPVQSFFRKAAFNALSLNRSEKCELTLIKLTRSWRPEIKRLAQNAIHKRRENIYGDRQ